MATEFSLRPRDGRDLGSFANVQALLQRVFPRIDFGWTTSGPEKVRQAEANGVKLPEAIRRWMEALPAVLEGFVEGDDYLISFGLGYEEPVRFLTVEPRGVGDELQRNLEALEAAVGGALLVYGTDPITIDQSGRPALPSQTLGPEDEPFNENEPQSDE